MINEWELGILEAHRIVRTIPKNKVDNGGSSYYGKMRLPGIDSPRKQFARFT